VEEVSVDRAHLAGKLRHFDDGYPRRSEDFGTLAVGEQGGFPPGEDDPPDP